MSPETHLLASWLVAAKTTDNQRDCRLVTLAGILPDLDGLGLVADLVNKFLFHWPTNYYPNYHHYLLHGLFGAAVVTLVFGALARRSRRVMLLTFLVFHLHLLCDFVGSRGPERFDLWPIHYLGPFSRTPVWLWHGQWRLDGWQNQMISVALFAWVLWLAAKQGHSPVRVFNSRADEVFVGVLRKWQANWEQWRQRRRTR